MPGVPDQIAMLRMSRSFDPAGFPYDFGRPRLQNPNGTFSTEETITVGFGDRYYNIPTIWAGQRVPPEVAVRLAESQMKRGTAFPNFSSLEEAEKQARLRSYWRGLLEKM